MFHYTSIKYTPRPMNKPLPLAYSVCLYIMVKGVPFNSRKWDYWQLVLFSITNSCLCNPISYHKWPASWKVCLFFNFKHHFWLSLRILGQPTYCNLSSYPFSSLQASTLTIIGAKPRGLPIDVLFNLFALNNFP